MHHMWKTRTQFVKRVATGGSFLNILVNKFPFEMHLPGHNFTGPERNSIQDLIRNERQRNGACQSIELTTQLIITIYAIQNMMILKLGMRFVIRQCLVS